jgi:hypothetical protein
MRKYLPLLVSIFLGVTVVLSFGLIAECNDSNEGRGSSVSVTNSDEISNAVNNWINKKWDKRGYDSLSTLIQMSGNYSETIKANLKETLDGYYLHSMKVTFDDWKVQHCSDSLGFSIQDLINSMKDCLNQYPNSMYSNELKNCINEYNEIGQVASLSARVMSCLRSELDENRIISLRNEISNLRLKAHVINCSSNAQILDDMSVDLQNFEDMVENIEQLKSRGRLNNSIRVIIEQKFDLAKYFYYDRKLR